MTLCIVHCAFGFKDFVCDELSRHYEDGEDLASVPSAGGLVVSHMWC